MKKNSSATSIFLKDIQDTFEECLKIVHKKNADYSKGDDPWRNFNNSIVVNVKPEFGILVRMSDKLNRIANLISSQNKVEDESIEDSINDLINYSAILKSYLKTHRKQDSK